jgi:hypothetical protein
MNTISELDRLKRAAADAAVAMVEAGVIGGLGTGSTTWIALGILGQRVAEGLPVIGIPTSRQTEREARRLGIASTTPHSASISTVPFGPVLTARICPILECLSCGSFDDPIGSSLAVQVIDELDVHHGVAR